MKQILALDGGGVRGLVTASILARLHVKPDFIAGTSTGGLIAMMMAIGYDASTIRDTYKLYAPLIFSRPWWRRGLVMSKYSPDGIERAAKEIFGSRTMADCKIPTMCVSYSLPKGKPRIFKSWQDGDELLRDVARATSAAPTYFPPTQEGLVDGGICANNPSMCAYIAAKLLWPLETKFDLLSIGTGTDDRRIDARRAAGWGMAGWSTNVADMFMDSDSAMVDYQMRGLLYDSYRRIQPELGTIPLAMDCCDEFHIGRLIRLGEEWRLPWPQE